MCELRWSAQTAIAQVIVTTGGTGITSRDSTYEAITSLLDKTLDGFGELFRMLSYEQVGSAAMLSRACAGSLGRTAVFALPGSEQAVRLAMTKLILPGARTRRQGARAMTTMRPIRETIPLDEATRGADSGSHADRAAPSA